MCLLFADETKVAGSIGKHMLKIGLYLYVVESLSGAEPMRHDVGSW